MAKDLSSLYISSSFQRLLQVDPDDGATLLNGTGSVESIRVSGSLTVTDTLFAERLRASHSIIFTSGSNIFGDALTDTHEFTGSVSITGSLTVNGSPLIFNTGSLLTTASVDYSEITFTKGDSSTFVIDSTPRQVIQTVKNLEAGTLTKGTPVYASGSTGNAIHVYAASSSLSSRMPAAYMLKSNLTSGQEGEGLLTGFLNGLDTSACVSGDVLYVGPDGGFTKTKPTGTNLIQNLGKVIVPDATNGSIVLSGAGRANDVPNLLDNQIFFGSGSNQAQQIHISGALDQTVINNITASGVLLGAKVSIGDYGASGGSTSDELLISGSGLQRLSIESTDAAAGIRLKSPSTFNTFIDFEEGSDQRFIMGVLSSDDSFYIATGSALVSGSMFKANRATGDIEITHNISASAVSASTYFGDGSNLTGIIASNWTSSAGAITRDSDVQITGSLKVSGSAIELFSGDGDTIFHIKSSLSGDSIIKLESDTDDDNEGDNPRIEFTQDGGITGSAIYQNNNHISIANSFIAGAGIELSTGTANGYTNATRRMFITSDGNTKISGSLITTGSVVDFTKTAAISASIVSASTYYGDGSNLTGISSTPFPFAGDAVITGSLTISGSFNSFRVDSDDIVLGKNAGAALEAGTSRVVLIGENAGDSLTTSQYVVGIGYNALSTATNGTTGTVAIGYRAGQNTTTGDYSVYVGYGAGETVSTGTENVALGRQAMGVGTIAGSFNVALGSNAGADLTSGHRNVFIGYNAGNANTEGLRNVFIGTDAGDSGVDADYSIAIGDTADVAQGVHNQIAIGRSVATTAAGDIKIGDGNAGVIPFSGSSVTGDVLFPGDVTAMQSSAATHLLGTTSGATSLTLRSGNTSNVFLDFEEGTNNRYVIGVHGSTDELRICNNTASPNSNTALSVALTSGEVKAHNKLIASQSFTAGDTDSTALKVEGSGSVSGTALFEVVGSQGQLFSVTDDLSGTLFEANNISGLPVIQAKADNTVHLGKWGGYGITISGSTPDPADAAAKIFITGSVYHSGSIVKMNVAGSITNTGVVNYTPGVYAMGNTEHMVRLGPIDTIQITLPSASLYPGRQIFFKVTSSLGGGGVQFTGSASDTIDGSNKKSAAQLNLDDQWDAVSIISDGVSEWNLF